MQNTAVVNGEPIHIDVGEFVIDPSYQDPSVANPALFSKMHKLRVWLSKKYPELEKHLANQLYVLIGPEVETMRPTLRTVEFGD
jgi:hypothetical protein